jgi:uncharacterized iron-regulated membrane protein
MRSWLLRLHRWFGLFLALFLFLSGITGAVIAWDHEVDGWLNPEMSIARTEDGERQSAFELARQLEARDPRVRVTFFDLEPEPGHATVLWLDPKIDPSTREPYELDFDHVAVDPVTGEEQGRRLWGRISLDRRDVMSFLYKLHFTMHLPDIGSFETGVWFMGMVAAVWTIDCFVALVVAFPSRAQWRRSFAFRWRDRIRIVFDVHRSGGVWTWLLLLTLAVTAAVMNLDAIARPVVGAFLELTPDPFTEREERPIEDPVIPAITFEEIVEIGRAEGRRRGLSDPPGGTFYSPGEGLYGVGFYRPGMEHADGRLGNPWLYFDGIDGSYQGQDIPGSGTFGDTFLQAQFPIHSGRLFGFWGRVAVSLLGVVTAVLSVTGVWLWARRQRWAARKAAAG